MVVGAFFFWLDLFVWVVCFAFYLVGSFVFFWYLVWVGFFCWGESVVWFWFNLESRAPGCVFFNYLFFLGVSLSAFGICFHKKPSLGVFLEGTLDTSGDMLVLTGSG